MKKDTISTHRGDKSSAIFSSSLDILISACKSLGTGTLIVGLLHNLLSFLSHKPLESKRPEFVPQQSHLLDIEPWKGHVISINLSFLICKMRLIIKVTLQTED